MEDESYFWTVIRYIHLNAVRGERSVVSHPRDWPWCSYPGYADKRKRFPMTGFLVDVDGKPIIAQGRKIDLSVSLEASGELATDGRWASDTGEPIEGYLLRSKTNE